jgi:hypothetical protein
MRCRHWLRAGNHGPHTEERHRRVSKGGKECYVCPSLETALRTLSLDAQFPSLLATPVFKIIKRRQ